MNLARSSLVASVVLPLVAACGGGGGGGGGGAPEPSVIRRMGLIQTASTRLGTSSCAGHFTGDDTEQILAVGCAGTSAAVCDTGWSIYLVDPFGSVNVAPAEIPAMAAIRRAVTLYPGGPEITTFDGDSDGIDDLVVAVPASGAIFVVFDPLSAAASVAGPFTIPDGPLSTPRYGTMVLRRNRDYGILHDDPDVVMIGMPDAGRGRGQIAWCVAAASRAGFGAGSFSAPYAPAGLASTAAFGSAVDAVKNVDGTLDVFSGAPGESGGGAVYKINLTLETRWVEGFEKLTPAAELGTSSGFGSALAIAFDVSDVMSVAIGAPGAFAGEGAVIIQLPELRTFDVIRSPEPGRRFGSEMDALHIEGDGNETILVTQPNCGPDGSGAVGMRINWDIIGHTGYEEGTLRKLSMAPIGRESTICAVRKCIPRVNCRTDFVAWFEGALDGSGVLAVRDLTDKRHVDYVAPKMTP